MPPAPTSLRLIIYIYRIGCVCDVIYIEASIHATCTNISQANYLYIYIYIGCVCDVIYIEASIHATCTNISQANYLYI